MTSSSPFFSSEEAGTAVLGESQYTATLGTKNLSSFYLSHLLVLSTLSGVPVEEVQLHLLAVHQFILLILQEGHQQGPGTIYNANVVLIAEAKRLTTNANIYSINLHSKEHLVNRVQQ